MSFSRNAWLSACLVITVICTFSTMAQEISGSEEAADSSEQGLSQEQQEYIEWADNLWSNIVQMRGEVHLPGDVAVLNVPEGFYFLNSKDAKTVLVDVWGNPDSGQSVLGMLFPSDTTPFERESWGVTIEYEQDGYVDDSDAASIDYDDLLKEMQADTKNESQQRVEMGYEPISLVGWAAQPYYDQQSNKLHWAQEIQFGDAQVNTLNYNIRVLGRQGVLVLNFIAGMDQLDVINQNLDDVLAIAEFKQGSRYADFDPEMDEVAAYGVGALVAGKVIAKTGLFAAALLFLKKFGVFILIGVGVLLRKLFAGRKTKTEN